ncbi:hypothetical protein GW915_12395 [bacterium]|nr:hypothetical protein [bacterium]
MRQRLLFSLIILPSLLWSTASFSNSKCNDAVKDSDRTNFSNNPIVAQLNLRLTDPAYKVIVLGRHGKASQTNKFTAAERQEDPAKVELDIERPLAKKGRKAANRLANLMSHLSFRDVGMWGSPALRVQSTAEPTINVIGDALKVSHFDRSLYYADVPKEMQKLLTADEHSHINHAFFWGHGKTTLALFKELTGVTEGFLPTAAVMFVVVKADNWKQVFEGKSEQVEAYAWSPNKSHQIEGGNTPVASLESLGGLESAVGLESISVPSLNQEATNQGFQFTVLKGNYTPSDPLLNSP